ncbi:MULTISPECIES: hypothetical protein [Rhizobium]|uniref:hypothetical protein n=1 Tax=Rhizobium TaxID=379 RepID=UPI0007E9DCF0|nr:MULTISPECIES: hypothetical protein [Rhizobium]ANK95349.1 hypothetical protein AMK01_PD00470 [Rhizobium sp. N6212]ANL01402.1 hypothetical protein AMK00_PD00469 [Rhizobium sp. N621]ANL07525.1 hypothetical protein AMJ99_PD00471 [Rhizobium esperanzae]ANL13695.1 hypothetical protein AMJ98_PE00471 [Rhizobium sp. N1341]ANL25679.1 hypothetical protein AMJ96_PD00478 [Rhizobium sp. N113]
MKTLWKAFCGAATMLFDFRAPFAVPTIMAGIDLSLMTALDSPVAGITGSRRRREIICGAIRTVDIATSITTAITVVV